MLFRKNTENKKTDNKERFSLADMLMKFFNSPMSIDQVAEMFSKDIDKLILKESNATTTYMGGSFIVALKTEKEFMVGYQLYFKNSDGKYINKSANSEGMSIEYLDEAAKNELAKNKKIEFEIETPVGK